jgi:hypothetical protein
MVCSIPQDDVRDQSRNRTRRLLYFRAVRVRQTTISRSRYGVDLGGARGTRTPDPLLAKQVLFQLSYSPELRRS